MRFMVSPPVTDAWAPGSNDFLREPRPHEDTADRSVALGGEGVVDAGAEAHGAPFPLGRGRGLGTQTRASGGEKSIDEGVPEAHVEIDAEPLPLGLQSSDE